MNEARGCPQSGDRAAGRVQAWAAGPNDSGGNLEGQADTPPPLKVLPEHRRGGTL